MLGEAPASARLVLVLALALALVLVLVGSWAASARHSSLTSM